MKKIIFLTFLVFPFLVNSQNLTKSLLTILDVYIEKEPEQKGFNKDSVIFVVSFFKTDEIESNIGIFISMYDLKYYPITDSLKVYKGVKMRVEYPKNMRKLSKYFKSITDMREIKDKEKKKEFMSITNGDGSSKEIIEIEDYNPIYESTSNYLFQINKNNEIYIISTSDDDYYYKRFREKKLKFSKDLMFSKDLLKLPSVNSSQSP